MSDFFEFILETETEAEYRLFFSGPDEIESLEFSVGRPRLWRKIPTEISRDLIGIESALAAAEEHFAQLDEDDERARNAFEDERIRRGIVGH